MRNGFSQQSPNLPYSGAGDFWSQYGVNSKQIYTGLFEKLVEKERDDFDYKLGRAFIKEKARALARENMAEKALDKHRDKLREEEVKMYRYIDKAQNLWT